MTRICLLVYCCLIIGISLVSGAQYYGKKIGTLAPYQHGVRGEVFAASNKRIYVTDFYYDGQGPDAFAWMGDTNKPDRSGTIIAVNGSTGVLRGHSNAILRIDLPEGKTLYDYKWLSFWCRRFGANFADVYIEDVTTFQAPAPLSLGELGFSPRVHNVHADEVIIVNHRQIQFVNLDYDGNGPDAYYWAGTGGTPSPSGFALADDSRSGSLAKIPSAFIDKTVTVTIPVNRGDITDIGHVGLWCVRATQDFGHLDIPANLNVPPFDDKSAVPFVPSDTFEPDVSLDNCKVLLNDMYQVRWSVNGASINVALSARIDRGTYMAFGLSGSDTRTTMVGSDVTVAWLDAQSGATANAVDYYLSDYQQCVTTSGLGACSDELSTPAGINDVTVGDHSNMNGIITISYTRPLDTNDTNGDQVIATDGAKYVSWAIGPINRDGLAAKHRQLPTGDVQVNFGQQYSTCPPFTVGNAEQLKPWKINKMKGDERTDFQLDIGQAGGQQGYEGITGNPGWGIAWYVNGYLIPTIQLKRNITYTFTVNGGDDQSVQANYHPFYITNEPDGGYYQLTDAEKQGVVIYAGPAQGPLCEWRSSGTKTPDMFKEFSDYRNKALEYSCASQTPTGSSNSLTWTPDAYTPDLVYYQCYTHKFLGWKIEVVDEFTDAANPTTVSLLTLLASMLLTILVL